MTDLHALLPSFPTSSHAHLLPTLERQLITTTDLLTLDALDLSKRTHLPILDLKHLTDEIRSGLLADLGVQDSSTLSFSSGHDLPQSQRISTLDASIDAHLGGGFPTRYLTEICGESGSGKTQLLLTLLLSAQLPSPHGTGRATMYISTEHGLPTSRIVQLMRENALLSQSHSVSLDRIYTLTTPDLETQEHILRYQLPVALERHEIGLVVIDSIAANFRAERTLDSEHANLPSSSSKQNQRSRRAELGARAADLARLGAHLRDLARRFNVAVVVANQVSDRIDSDTSTSTQRSSLPSDAMFSSSPAPHSHSHSQVSSPSPFRVRPSSGPQSHSHSRSDALARVLSVEQQQKFYTGWGDTRMSSNNAKTPTLGLSWTNQLAGRVALYKDGGRRRLRVVFAGWKVGEEHGNGEGVEFEVCGAGIRAVRTEKDVET